MAENGFDIGRVSQSLSIVVPVYKIRNRSENLVKWISSPQIKFAEIIFVHDLSDNEDCDFLRENSSVLENVTLIEEFCGSPGASRDRTGSRRRGRSSQARPGAGSAPGGWTFPVGAARCAGGKSRCSR